MAATTGPGQELSVLLCTGRKAALSGAGRVTVVLGNEAADLDSIVCAVAVAAALQSGGADACAVAAVPRADLRLRPEVGWVFQTTGVDIQALTCADELDLVELARSGREVDVVLVGAQPVGVVTFPLCESAPDMAWTPLARSSGRPQQADAGAA
jgi:hypothetical protein